MLKIKPNQKYWAEIQTLPNGGMKLVKAKKHTVFNQHKRSWVTINARELARNINTSKLVIK